jgi:ELWxxDGT repeat protein
MNTRVLTPVLALAAPVAVQAFDSVRLVKDIVESAPASAPPASLIESDGQIIYRAASGVWRSDGTASGTVSITSERSITAMARLGDRYIVTATFGWLGQELGELDIRTGALHLIRDIAPGADSSSPIRFLVAGQLLYFIARDDEHGAEFWRTDGTSDGTFLVGEITPGPGSSDHAPSATAIPIGQRLVVFTQGPQSGIEPWLIDGLMGEVRLIRDISLGISSSIQIINPAVGLEQVVVFPARNASGKQELWATDGSEAGTIQLTDSNAPFGGQPRTLARVGDAAYFVGALSSTTSRLFRTDGTVAGTREIDLGATGPTPGQIRSIFPVGLEIALGVGPSSAGTLWLTDDSGETIRAVQSGFSSPAMEYYGQTSDGITYFSASTSAAGRELWRTDGSSPATMMVADINPGSSNGPISPPTAMLVDEQFYFAADGGETGVELWVSDGSLTGTHLVRDLRSNISGDPFNITTVGDRAFYLASELSSGTELWVSDASGPGTHIARDTNPGPASNFPTINALGNIVICDLNDGQTGRELWRSNGTPEGTYQLLDLRPGSSGSNPRNFFRVGAELIFFATGPDVSNSSFWRTDGTSVGTAPAIPLPSGYSFGGVTPLWAPISGGFLFAGEFGSEGHELWRADLSTGAFWLVSDIVACTAGSSPELLTPSNGFVYFRANRPDTGVELWRTDGYSTGTQLVADIRPGEIGSRPQPIIAMPGYTLFSANDGVHGHELWRTDGTPSGTYMLRDIAPGAESSSPSWAVAIGTRAFFIAATAESGHELWVTDGTPENTRMVRDIYAGPAGGVYPSPIAAFGNSVFFGATDSAHGNELWRSDGTISGTVRVSDAVPGSGSLFPYGIAAAANQVYFRGNDGNHGVELWVYSTESNADQDGDGDVDIQDLVLLLSAFGTCAGDLGYNASADLAGDGCIGAQDVAALLAEFGR